MNEEKRRFRRVVSDVSWEMAFESSTRMVEEDEVKQAECECCGFKEDCTADYITRVKVVHGGKWVCGLCSEDVKERLNGAAPMEDAVSSHREFCQNFNTTTRLNPKLSLTCAMRGIAKRSHDSRRGGSGNSKASNFGRTTSCIPKIDFSKHSLV